MNMILFGESINQSHFMLINPAFQIIGNSDIHYMMIPVGQNIHVISFVAHNASQILRCAQNDTLNAADCTGVPMIRHAESVILNEVKDLILTCSC